MSRVGALCTCGQCRRYKRLSAQFRAHCKKLALPCWLCQEPIDYQLEHTHPESFSNDHMKPRSLFPDLTEDPANFMPSHSVCNKKRGNSGPIAIGNTSRNW